jgi:RNA polymerase sigma factor for flagellar operon FliA
VSQRKLQPITGGTPEARASPDELAERHLPLVIHIARDFRKRIPSSVDFDDLVGAGNIGLVEAARRFSPNKGASFTTFARHRIRGAIADFLRKLDPVSRYLRRQQKAAERTISDLTTAKQRVPTEREIARRLRLRVDDWRKLSRTLYEAGCPVSGFAPPATVPLDQLASRWRDPERQAHAAELIRILAGAMETLPNRYQHVIRLHDFEDWTMKRIGQELGVNESRVSQIRTAALKRLQGQLMSTIHD